MQIPYSIKKCVYKRNRIYWVKWSQDGKARYESTEMTNKELAFEKADQIVISHLKDKGIVTKDIVLSELIDKVLLDLHEQVRNKVIVNNTLLFYKNFLESIREQLGSYSFNQITIEDIEKYVRDRRNKKNLSLKTVEDEYLTWNKIYKYAVTYGYCKENIIERIIQPKKKTRKKIQEKLYILSEEQINTLISLATPYLSEIILFLYNTGMRKGELKNLRFQDVDLKKGILHIRPHDGWQPKNGIERTIPINEIVGRIVKTKFEERMPKQKYVFISSNGNQAYHYHKSFQNIMKKAGYYDLVPEGMGKGVHLLRHSFCSFMVNEVQAPLPVVKEIMGHQDIKTTMTYVHTDERQKKKAIKKFDFMREFQKLRKEGKSVNSSMKAIAIKYNELISEVEDILIGLK